jgi:hypothetical protein
MNSAHDLPKEGFPHSDIRGSTIARISPRLFAACHVLHRLLAPRHPPNALITLPSHQNRPHAGPSRALSQGRASPSVQAASATRAYAQRHSHLLKLQPIPDSPVKDQTAPARDPSGPGTDMRRFWKHASPRPRPKGYPDGARGPLLAQRPAVPPSGDFSRGTAAGKMEATGFEPTTPCLQSRCSTN